MATQFSPAIFKKAVEAKCRIEKIDANHYRVTPRAVPNDCTNEHGVYIVSFTLDSYGWPEIESCREETSGSQCKGFRFSGSKRSCYHAASASIHYCKPLLKKALKIK